MTQSKRAGTYLARLNARLRGRNAGTKERSKGKADGKRADGDDRPVEGAGKGES